MTIHFSEVKTLLNNVRRRIMGLILNLTLKIRIILLYLILTSVVIIFISYFSYITTLNLLIAKETSILEDTLDYVANQIDTKFERICEQFLSTFNESGFKKLIIKNAKDNIDQASLTILSGEFVDYSTNIINRNYDIIKSILLISKNKRIMTDSYISGYKYDELIKTEYYKKVMREKNLMHFINIKNRKDEFVIARSFYYLEGSDTSQLMPGYESNDIQDYNVFMFILKKNYLQKLVDEVAERRKIRVYLLDEYGDIIVQDGTNSEEKEFDYNAFLKEEVFEGKGSYEINQYGYHLKINYKSIRSSNWHLIYMYDQNVLYHDAAKIRNSILVILVVSLFFFIFAAIFISNTVVRPICKLSKLMDDAAENNNLSVRFQVKYNDEISHLGITFNRMIQRINELIVKIQNEERLKRKEELRALQAQINPHFLYNTLDTIYWIAKVEKNENIANIVADLADFFRLSLNKGEEITTVQKEINHVKKYLSIQTVRYAGKFEYKVFADERLLQEKIPKLILQPLVENAIVHGFSGVKYKGEIEIHVYRIGKDLCLSVKDNGKGVDKTVLNKLKAENNNNNSDSVGYALRNLNERIRLYSEKEYGVSFEEGNGIGTTAIILFPVGYGLKGGDEVDKAPDCG